jgi:gamma-glutamyltranspeptidase/glutathione hydrolase
LRAAIVQTVVNVVDHGLGVADAIDTPRIHLDGDDLHVEGGTDPSEADELAARGYRVIRWPGDGRSLYFGGVSAVGLRAEAELEASGDVRRGGHGVVVGAGPSERG